MKVLLGRVPKSGNVVTNVKSVSNRPTRMTSEFEVVARTPDISLRETDSFPVVPVVLRMFCSVNPEVSTAVKSIVSENMVAWFKFRAKLLKDGRMESASKTSQPNTLSGFDSIVLRLAAMKYPSLLLVKLALLRL